LSCRASVTLEVAAAVAALGGRVSIAEPFQMAKA
jgi:hypothetical protein